MKYIFIHNNQHRVLTMDLVLLMLSLVNLSCLLDKHQTCISAEQVIDLTTHRQTSFSQESYYNETTSTTDDVNSESGNMYDEYGDYYYGYYNLNTNVEMTFDIIDTYLDKNETKDFLYSFHNVLQREIIRQQLRYCPYISLCNFSFGLVGKDHTMSCCAPCSCDIPKCLRYQTCCPDILNSSMFHLASRNDQKDSVIGNKKVQEEWFTCTLLHVKRSFSASQNSAYMLAHCPLTANNSQENMCTRQYTNETTSLEDMIPVSVSGQVINYRNKYCAFCYGVPIEMIKFWYHSLSCNKVNNIEISTIIMQPEQLLINYIFSTDKCDLGFVPRQLDQVQDCRSAIGRCNETGLWKKYDPDLEIGCSLYTSAIKIDSKVFRNIFCLMCNGYEPRVPSILCEGIGPGYGESFSFSGLIKRRSQIDDSKKDHNNISCNKSTIFDTTTGRCLPLFCNELYHLQSGKCVKIFDSVRNSIYKLYLRLVPVETVTVSETHLMIDDIVNTIYKDLFKNTNYFPSDMILKMCDFQLLYRANFSLETSNLSAVTAGDSPMLSIDVRFKLTVDEHDPYKVANILNSLSNYNISCRYSKSNITFKIITRDDSLNLAYDIVQMLSYLNYISTHLPLNDLLRHSARDSDGHTLIPYITYSTMFCEESRDFNAAAIRECAMVKLSIKSTSTKQINDTNIYVYKNFSFLQTEFNFENNTTIKVCVEAFLRFVSKSQSSATGTIYTDDIEKLVSITCISLSITCLLITLFTFTLFPTLRTFPGMNTFSLCLFSVLAQSLYLIGSFAKIDSETVWCKVLGLLIHFFWLAAIFWMNICTFHMFRVLTHTRARSATKWNTFVSYHIFSFISSLSCILVNIGFSFYFSNNIGYGNHLCYISSQLMTTYTFGLPVLLVILANVGMFSAVIVSVKRKASIHQTSSVERNDFLIFIKLSSLTGFSWLFGFIFYWTELPVFSYIFIILNSCQGVFIMFSFVINKRILNLYKTGLQKIGKPHLRRSGSRTYHVWSHGSDSKSSTENCHLTRQMKHVHSPCSSQTTSL